MRWKSPLTLPITIVVIFSFIFWLNMEINRESSYYTQTSEKITQAINARGRWRFETQLMFSQQTSDSQRRASLPEINNISLFTKPQPLNVPNLSKLSDWPLAGKFKRVNDEIMGLRTEFLSAIKLSESHGLNQAELQSSVEQLVNKLDEHNDLLVGLNQHVIKRYSEIRRRGAVYNVGLIVILFVALFISYRRQNQRLIKQQDQLNQEMAEKNQSLTESAKLMGNILEDVRIEKDRALELANENAKLAMIVHQATQSIFQLDNEQKINTANTSAKRMFEKLATPLVGLNFVDLFLGSSKKDCENALLQVFEKNETVIFEAGKLTSLEAKGKRFEIILTPLLTRADFEDGSNLLGISASVVDISHRYEEREQLQLIISQAPNALIMVSAKGEIMVSNNQAEQLFGYEAGALNGCTIEELVPDSIRASHPEYISSFFKETEARAMGGGRDLMAKHHLGHEIPVEIGLSPITTSQGKFVVACVVDISERLKHRRALEDVNAALTQKNREMEQFVYTVSHDLKSPLVSIGGFTQKLQQELVDYLNERQEHKFRRILANVNHMEGLLKDLLDLSRVIRQSVERDWLELDEVVDKALGVLEVSLQKTEAEVDVVRPLGFLAANETLLLRCLENLISNAINYRDPNRGLKLKIYADHSGDYTTIHVQDNGLGIDEKYHEQIFRIFERLSLEEGSGVGLAIVKTVMEKHDGSVSLVSNPGQGSTFSLNFPNLEVQKQAG